MPMSKQRINFYSNIRSLAILLCFCKPWQVFVGNDIDEPLPYTGHLDAGGIAAHLAMLERVSEHRMHWKHRGVLETSNPATSNTPMHNCNACKRLVGGML